MIDRRTFCGGLLAAPFWLQGAVAPSEVEFAPVKLRGFGTVSARFFPLPDAGGSLLTIECDSPAKAALVHAKYLSDLMLLPGVRASRLRGFPTWEVDSLGFIAAAVSGKKVLIGCSARADGLRDFDSRGLKFEAGVGVPMYLDRWDKYGFLFYYRVGARPPTLPANRQYLVRPEFEYAKASGSGFVFWAQEDINDTAEGLTADGFWDWAAEQARALGLPMHINLSSTPGTWLLNRYRGETAMKENSYVGSSFRTGVSDTDSMGLISLNSKNANDVNLGVIQQNVRRFESYPNVVGWLEPHGEQFQGFQEFLLERGPAADLGFRGYLSDRYSLAALGARWYGDASHFRSWDEVKVPVYASFFGYGPDAIDLEGEWRIEYDFERRDCLALDFNDSDLPVLIAPGDDRALFLPKKRALFRRKFTVPPAWRDRHKEAWLYVWDLNRSSPDKVEAYLNGEKVGDSPIVAGSAHWAAFEVSKSLREGPNALVLRLPQGFLGYKVYLSPDPPKQYPGFGSLRNAQWVDFIDWWAWSKVNVVRRGVQMIRQVDPDRPVNFMHPDDLGGGIKEVCREYGGNFHNTGYMSGFWADYNAMICRGSGLPCSAEPGSGAVDGPDFLRFMGRWLTEGIQGISYFIHIGDVMWRDDIRGLFEKNLPMYRMIGKYHVPAADVAILYSDRAQRLTQYPGGTDPNVNLYNGYWEWSLSGSLLPLFPRDGLTEEDFHNGNALKYKVILDSNTSIAGDELLAGIQAYVRAGGVFVTFMQTGRHSPTAADAWPISKLTGYQVSHIDPCEPEPSPATWRKVRLAKNQKVLARDPWTKGIDGTGLTLRRISPECEDLLVWEDGSTAVGFRPLGKGFLIHVGSRFESLQARGSSAATTALFTQILNWREAARVPAQANGVTMRHYISNNGIYDIWVLFNESAGAKTTDLVFDASLHPVKCVDANGGGTFPVVRDAAGDRISGIRLGAFETRMFLMPRTSLADSPREWLTVQRNWWQGVTDAPREPLPTLKSVQRHTLSLADDWAFRSVDGLDESALLAVTLPNFDDHLWERRRLAIWTLPDHPDIRRAMFRNTFAVPANWTNGSIQLYLNAWFGPTFFERGRLFLDGRQLAAFQQDGIKGDDFSGAFQPGSTHTMAIEISGRAELLGVDGNAWLHYRPKPLHSLDLAGTWEATGDILHSRPAVHFPGLLAGQSASRKIHIGRDFEHLNAVLSMTADGPVLGVMTNGKFVQRHHHMNGRQIDLDISPWLRHGSDNRVEVVLQNPAVATIHSISLDFFSQGIYP